MIDYTEVFNKARIAQGLNPIRANSVTIVIEGMITGCGCKVTNASGMQYTIYHWSDDCKYNLQGKQVIGDGTSNATASTRDKDVLAMVDPWCGLWPHEQDGG